MGFGGFGVWVVGFVGCVWWVVMGLCLVWGSLGWVWVVVVRVWLGFAWVCLGLAWVCLGVLWLGLVFAWRGLFFLSTLPATSYPSDDFPSVASPTVLDAIGARSENMFQDSHGRSVHQQCLSISPDGSAPAAPHTAASHRHQLPL